jgi:hypothetical protein
LALNLKISRLGKVSDSGYRPIFKLLENTGASLPEVRIGRSPGGDGSQRCLPADTGVGEEGMKSHHMYSTVSNVFWSTL